MERQTEWKGIPIAALLRARLGPLARRWVRVLGELGRERGEAVYLVGGLVRDLLLQREHRDLDVTLEGDGDGFAAALAARVDGLVRRHPEFLTAVVRGADGFEVDIVTARAEGYPEPAVLPSVRPGDLRSDLLRRDFGANALAIQISGVAVPELVDLCGGLADLEAHRLRVLHDASFRDDPTRILRGVRLEARLGFRFDAPTEAQARAAVKEGIFDRLSGSRLRHELELLLEETGLAPLALARLSNLGVLRAIHPALRWNAEVAARLRRVQGLVETEFPGGRSAPGVWPEGGALRRWRLLLMALATHLSEEQTEELAERLLLEGADRHRIAGFPKRMQHAAARLAGPAEPAPHAVAEALEELSEEELLLAESGPDPRLSSYLNLYRKTLRGLTLGVRGADLVAAGYPPGPAIGHALRAVRRARWDGRLGPEGELEYALEVLEGLRREGTQAVPAGSGDATLLDPRLGGAARVSRSAR
jgi:tRNA nucleotidyltransferase (CCA-adding enzyme)